MNISEKFLSVSGTTWNFYTETYYKKTWPFPRSQNISLSIQSSLRNPLSSRSSFHFQQSCYEILLGIPKENSNVTQFYNAVDILTSCVHVFDLIIKYVFISLLAPINKRRIVKYTMYLKIEVWVHLLCNFDAFRSENKWKHWPHILVCIVHI